MSREGVSGSALRRAALFGAGLLMLAGALGAADEPARKIDPKTGLAIDKGFEIVSAWCTSCHSAALVRRSNMTRERWLETIRWMQETQGLWDLGEKEDEILDYLSKNYGVSERAGTPGVIPLQR